MHNCERNNKSCHKCAHRVIFNLQINAPCSFLPHPKRRGGAGEGTRGEVSVRCGPCLICYYLFLTASSSCVCCNGLSLNHRNYCFYLWLLISSLIPPSLPFCLQCNTSSLKRPKYEFPPQRPAPLSARATASPFFLFLAESFGILYEDDLSNMTDWSNCSFSLLAEFYPDQIEGRHIYSGHPALGPMSQGDMRTLGRAASLPPGWVVRHFPTTSPGDSETDVGLPCPANCCIPLGHCARGSLSPPSTPRDIHCSRRGEPSRKYMRELLGWRVSRLRHTERMRERERERRGRERQKGVN